MPFSIGCLLLWSFINSDSKTDVIAVYNLDSMATANNRCIYESKLAQQNYQNSRRWEQEPGIPKSTDKKTNEKIAADKKKVGQSPQDLRKATVRDSIYMVDSVGVRCSRRMTLIATDFQKTFGYKLVMTTSEYATYVGNPENKNSKNENVTKELILYANQDSVATKYRMYQY